MSQRHLQDDLDRLNRALVGLGQRAQAAVSLAVEALREGNRAKAYQVIDEDGALDAMELEIEEMAVNLLALQQPMARDLRFITTTMKIANDLERVGDHAVNIAETVHYILEGPRFPALPEIDEMARSATEMLAQSLDAFVRGDVVLAREVLRRDDRVDEIHGNNFRILLTHLMEDPRRIGVGMDLLLVSGNLERIADLATNIGEDTVYLVEGRSIKHGSGRSERPADRPGERSTGEA
jgi:phosphate transport system protein